MAKNKERQDTFPLSHTAHYLGISPQGVRRLVIAGEIPDGTKGLYDLQTTVMAYIKFKEGGKRSKDDSKTEFEKDKLEQEARFKELKVLEMEGSLVDADDVAKEAFNAGRQIRDSITNLSDRLAPLLAVESDPDKVYKIISDEVRKVLEGAKDDRTDKAT